MVVTSKLCQEPYITFIEETDMVDAEFQHRKAFYTHSKRKSAVLLRVYARVFEHRRMYHAASNHLEPSGVLTYTASLSMAEDTMDIHFSAGFSEREV